MAAFNNPDFIGPLFGPTDTFLYKTITQADVRGALEVNMIQKSQLVLLHWQFQTWAIQNIDQNIWQTFSVPNMLLQDVWLRQVDLERKIKLGHFKNLAALGAYAINT